MAYLLWHYLRTSAERDPSRPAVEWRDTVLSYGELDDRSGRLARFLAAHGCGRDCRVALYLPKSPQAVVAMLAASKAGAAYVPLDPNAPPRRAVFILNDCQTGVLITTARKLVELKEFAADLRRLKLIVVVDGEEPQKLQAEMEIPTYGLADVERFDGPEQNLGSTATENDPAYLLYTSGSTGNPKGVILSHRHALTFVDWAARCFSIGPEDRLSNHAPLHFDLSVFDIYAALRCGACVAIVPDEVGPFPVELARWIETQGITVWYSVPSALTRLLLRGQLERFEYAKLRTVLFAGEVFPVKYLRGVMERFGRADFFNLYGPTETNVCTYYPVPRPLAPEVAEIPIGKACANTDLVALDDSGRPIAGGESGELYVRGPTVMLGYWGLPEKTQAVLVRNPLQPAYEDRLYRTGDIVRLERDGEYMFIGRRDHMVKSRGYRIELGEIEQVLYEHARVKEAVVVAIPDDEIGARLNAVVASHKEDGQALSETELQAHCIARLPKYMVPERFVFRRELPKTSTGKADRVAVARLLTPTHEGDGRDEL